VVLEFELRAWSLLGRCSPTWATLTALAGFLMSRIPLEFYQFTTLHFTMSPRILREFLKPFLLLVTLTVLRNASYIFFSVPQKGFVWCFLVCGRYTTNMCVIFITYQGYYQLITFNGNLDHLAGLLYLSGSYEPFPAFWREVTMFRLKLGSEELCSTSLMVE
jgi:hypothetical protein